MPNTTKTTVLTTLSRLFLALAFLVCLPNCTQAEDEPLTVLVTGANRGLGLEHAKQWTAAGHKVIGTARKPAEAKELKATGAQVLQLDITSDDDIANLAKELKGQKIDVLINNAGYMNRGLNREALQRCFNINATGPLLLAKALQPNLKLSKHPKIVNISSGLGSIARTRGSYAAYSMSKAALNMATRQLHGQLAGDGFIVISLNPGHNKTDMGGAGAPLDPKDSVPQMLKLITGLKPDQSGKFWYINGSEVPW
ncbi:SDR family oxidoreductase [Verrucomicrobiaceae bacterium 5K15]|uniref:SDR family oxidoreductase n=1 Tax=Oceaniferula flava TaxID=2800421 RepID=A0AAE2V8S0_9BACT|nr:SDR family oxidoreductase [Oceaniferula flavus]MBK1855927.1 SDR family oxidoreductase [Oceaniferula flavus]MBM1137234.1 SDR family oxidoreductase [Oceaniferula flavus]